MCIKLPVVETKIAPVKQRHWCVKIMNASNTDLDLTQISVKISLRDHWWIFQIYKVPCEICGLKLTHVSINMLRIFNHNRKVSLKWQNELHTCLTAKFNSGRIEVVSCSRFTYVTPRFLRRAIRCLFNIRRYDFRFKAECVLSSQF